MSIFCCSLLAVFSGISSEATSAVACEEERNNKNNKRMNGLKFFCIINIRRVVVVYGFENTGNSEKMVVYQTNL